MKRRNGHLPPTTPEEYLKYGLGPLPNHADLRELYLDAIKRSLTNLLYEDRPAFIYGKDKQAKRAECFDLRSRIYGEDFPLLAHTMVGIKRLENIQKCLTDVLENRIPGDIVEAGVFRGGSAIFARAVLKSYGVTDRRVLACDTFADPDKLGIGRKIGHGLICALTYIPGEKWRKKLFRWLQPRVWRKRFPDSPGLSDELINLNFWILRNSDVFKNAAGAGLEHVKSYFARYGLLDDQVVFVRGFFSETLNDAPVARIALLRLDADIYESTKEALTILYPKLSPGGYCIIDDYHLTDCANAVDEYRMRHEIREPLVSIDDQSVYWTKYRSQQIRSGIP